MNIPGIFQVEFFDNRKTNLPFLKSNSSINILDYVRSGLSKIEFIPDTAFMKSPSVEKNGNQYFSIKVNFLVAGHDPEKIQLFRKLQAMPHSFVITDKMKVKYLLGLKKGSQAKFSYELKNTKSGRSIECEISINTTAFPIYVAD